MAKRFTVLMNLKLLSLLVCMFLSIQANAGTNYYISSSQGDDANDGLTPESAWRTPANIRLKGYYPPNFEPGDSILFKRGDFWARGNSSIRANGTEANPIVIASYGEGPAPLLIGHVKPSPWTPVEGHPGVYSAPLELGTVFSNVYAIPTLLQYVPSGELDLLDPVDIETYLSNFTPGTVGPPWGATGRSSSGETDIMWIRTFDDTPPVDVMAFWGAAFYIARSSSYIIIDGFEIIESQGAIDIEGSDHCVARNNQIKDMHDVAVFLRWDNTNCLIENNIITRTGNDGILILTGSHNTLRGNTISHVGAKVTGLPANGDRDGIGLQESGYNLVEYNHVSFVFGQGCAYFEEVGSTQRYNYYYHVSQGSVPYGTSLIVHHNIFDCDWQGGRYGRGMNVVNQGGGPILIYNNIYYRVTGGISASTAVDSIVFRNNIIYSVDPRQFGHWVVNDKVDSDYNLYFGSQKFRDLNNIWYESFEDYQAAGHEPHSFYAEPEFVSDNPLSPEDFRLAVNSPAIDAGEDLRLSGLLDLAYPYVDFSGGPIPLGSTADLGAFEFDAGAIDAESCCGLWSGGMSGNTDCDNSGLRTLADITRLIDNVYISRTELCCLENGNVNGDAGGLINLADITRLIDYIYISKTETAVCQ